MEYTNKVKKVLNDTFDIGDTENELHASGWSQNVFGLWKHNILPAKFFNTRQAMLIELSRSDEEHFGPLEVMTKETILGELHLLRAINADLKFKLDRKSYGTFDIKYHVTEEELESKEEPEEESGIDKAVDSRTLDDRIDDIERRLNESLTEIRSFKGKENKKECY